MEFQLWESRQLRPGLGCFLIRDNWDDFGFKTQFVLEYRDDDGVREIGQVKIGRFGMISPSRVEIPGHFTGLGPDYFSAGQDPSYYENLNQLGEGTRRSILRALRDVAFDAVLFERVLQEPVMTTSLLRHVDARTVAGQHRRIAAGGRTWALYEFDYVWPAAATAGPPPRLNIRVRPKSHPPTNIHAVIGSNGVGKTRLLRNLARAVAADAPDPDEVGRIGGVVLDGTGNPEQLFVNLVVVSFSAFDQFEEFTDSHTTRGVEGVKCTLVTLAPTPRTTPHPAGGAAANGATDGRSRAAESADRGRPASGPAETYQDLIHYGLDRGSYARWTSAVETLESDPLFASASIIDGSFRAPDTRELFDNLSSGHKIVLLTMTHLASLVAERTLVLIDEPETHLHPPLLSALIRAISDLLVERNGAAVIATHSPVVLQEIPSSCVHLLRRSGEVLVAEQPAIETYGENVGVLTREVFGLEVTKSGFHAELEKMVEDGLTFEQVMARYGQRLGREAQAITRALIAQRDRLVAQGG